MARRRSFTSQLYRAARISNNISAIASGNPRRVARRAKNVALGRALGRGGFWRWLWKEPGLASGDPLGPRSPPASANPVRALRRARPAPQLLDERLDARERIRDELS